MLELSSESIKMLDTNGYALKVTDSSISFTKPRDLNWLIILTGFICVLLGMAFIRNPIPGLVICGSLVALTWLVFLFSRKKPFFELDLSNQRFRHDQFATPQRIDTITEISIQTHFEKEYASAFKETSEEHSVKLNLTFDSGTKLKILELTSDYKELTPEIEELYNYLKTLLTLAKQNKATLQ
ncbi:MAG: hypothetical protein ABJG41_05165 [Cyclobacteriaceae bacterium]